MGYPPGASAAVCGGQVMNVVIGLSGQLGSGKSTIARGLARAMHCDSASFGEYVRWLARRGEYYVDRQTLQYLGQDELDSRGAEQFCIDMLGQQVPNFGPGNRLVIDGVRHLAIARALRALLRPSEFFLIYMSVDNRVRFNRITMREISGGDGESLRKLVEELDLHPTEVEVRKALRGHADLTLSATRPSSELVRAVLQFISEEKNLRVNSRALAQ